jgi:hypothetical protein
VVLPTERPLYRRTQTMALDGGPIETDVAEIDSSSMFEQLHVDRDALLRAILSHLGPGGQLALDRLVADVPLEQGLAELVGYFSIRDPGLHTVFESETRTAVEWTDEDGDIIRVADLPKVIFARSAEDGS